MAVKTLDDFFRQKQSKVRAKDVNWEKRRKDWLLAIDGLYKVVVCDFLAKPISKDSVKFDYGMREITEAFFGTYQVPTLILNVGNELVTFVPKGANIVGGKGRVDIQGEMGEATLVLRPGARWALVAQRVPSVKLVPFDAASFLNVLKNVMRP